MSLQKIPRARFYLPNGLLLKALMRLPFSRPERSRTTDQVERELAKHFGVRHVRAVSSCRMAFHLVLKSLGLQEGDEVLLTPLTIPDMVNAIHTLGLKPVFVDMSLAAQNIDVADLRSKITPRSRVLLVTHLAGLVPDMQAILSVVASHKLLLIEDISQNWESSAQGKLIGTLGVAAVGSLSLGKTLASLGGGLILTSDDRLHDAVVGYAGKLLGRPNRSFLQNQIMQNLKFNLATDPLVFSLLTYPMIRALCHRNPSMINLLQEGKRASQAVRPEDLPFECNPRILRDRMPPAAFTTLCDLQSELLLSVLKTHRASNERRRELAHHLYAHLGEAARRCLPAASAEAGNHRNVYWHYPILIPEERERFQLFLLRYGIDNGGYSLALCSHEPAFARYAASTPCAKRIKENTVFLPIHSSFSKAQMEQIARVVNRYFEQFPPRVSRSESHVEGAVLASK